MRRHGGRPPCGTYRFVHAGDLHLDGPLRGISSAPTSLRTALRDASLRAWNSVVELAVEREAAFVILAGSVFDSDSPSVRSCVALRDGLQRLRSRAIDVFIALPAQEAAAARHLPLLTTGATLFAAERMSAAYVVRDGTCLAALHGMSGDAADVCARVEALRPTGSGLGIGVLSGAARLDSGGSACARATEVLAKAALGYWAIGGSHVQSVLQPRPPRARRSRRCSHQGAPSTSSATAPNSAPSASTGGRSSTSGPIFANCSRHGATSQRWRASHAFRSTRTRAGRRSRSTMRPRWRRCAGRARG